LAETEGPADGVDVCHWAAHYNTADLISVKSFDFKRTARVSLQTALRLSGAQAGFLATVDKTRELEVVVSTGIDEEGILEEPRLVPLYEAVSDGGAAQSHVGIAAGSLQLSGACSIAVVPLLLRLRPVGASKESLNRERRRFAEPKVYKPLGVLFVARSGNEPFSPEELQALERFAEWAGEVMTNSQLYRSQTHDPLTDLYRRHELDQHLTVETTFAKHTNSPVALVMVDIDNLGAVNRDFGRARGDKVISRVARLVRAQVRIGDACFRYGGEEFAVVLPGTDPEGALATAEKIRRSVEGYKGFGGGIEVLVSAGVAVYPQHADGSAELLRKADQSLFIAKQEGGNRSLLWHRRIPKHALRSDKLIGILTGNMAKDYRNVMMLLDTVVVVNSLMERNQVLKTLLDMLIQLSGCKRGALYLESEGEWQVEVALDSVGHKIEIKDVCSLAFDALRKQGLPVAGSSDDEENPELAEACRTLGLERVICMPLTVKGKLIGGMYFDSNAANREFGDSDLIFMRALARELGTALEKSRLNLENVEQKKELEELTARLAQKVQAQATELADLSRNLSQLQLRYNYDKIVGKSEAMQKVFKLLDRITDTDVPVLIQGETGTGKELVARALHVNGPRREASFVSVNCSAITESLMESELFGHVRGAFTGADRDKPGLFEQAHRGTIFLDEIQDMSNGMQRELLRVLQEGEIRRVGGKDIIHVDVRVISACNRDLREMVQQSQFRQDLFYRLNVVSIELPPLRDRKEDIPLLVQRLLEDARTHDGREVKLDKDALRAILRYDWPGNVRQLQNFIEKTTLLIEGNTIRAEHVTLDGERPRGGTTGISRLFEIDYSEAKQAFAREYLKAVLARNGGNVTRAAAEATIVRSSFHKMMRKHGISAKDFGTAKTLTQGD
jgi:diguanylate cyclase (GGDEF)-like protein